MTTEENEEQASEKTWGGGGGTGRGKKFCSFHTSLPSPSLPLAWEPKMLEIQMFKINSLANTSPRWNVPWKISQIWYIWNNLPRLNILFHMQMYTLSINRSSRISGQHCVFFLSFFSMWLFILIGDKKRGESVFYEHCTEFWPGFDIFIVPQW